MKSDFVFTLIEKYNVGLSINRIEEFTNESYFGFCNEYLKLSAQRDVLLASHIKTQSSIFRTFIPSKPGMFETAFQVQWYYDEIFIYDPIVQHLNRNKDNPFMGQRKNELLRLLSYLVHFRLSIEEGFILFINSDALSDLSFDRIERNKIDAALSSQDLREELDKSVTVYKLTSREDQNGNFSLRTIFRDQQNLVPVVTKPIKNEEGFYGINIDLEGSTYTKLTLSEIRELNLYNRVFSGMDDLYKDEICETLYYLSVGNNYKIPTLFSREVDKLILKNYTIDYNKSHQIFNLVLPFIENIPPESILEIRSKMPQAFTDFRNEMYILLDEILQTEARNDLVKIKVQQKVNPIVRKLDAEIRNSVLKTQIIGGVTPMIALASAFTLNHFGIDLSKELSLTVGIASQAVAIANRLTDINTIKANPYYFLWKVQHSK